MLILPSFSVAPSSRINLSRSLAARRFVPREKTRARAQHTYAHVCTGMPLSLSPSFVLSVAPHCCCSARVVRVRTCAALSTTSYYIHTPIRVYFVRTRVSVWVRSGRGGRRAGGDVDANGRKTPNKWQPS